LKWFDFEKELIEEGSQLCLINQQLWKGLWRLSSLLDAFDDQL